MSPAAMKARCPGSSFVCAGRFPGQFRINRFGTATVVLDRHGIVYGVLWTIAQSDERELDAYEGVEVGLYQKRTVEVLTSCGQRVRAFAYVAPETRPGPPQEGYLEEIIMAARGHGFPADYVRELATWLC